MVKKLAHLIFVHDLDPRKFDGFKEVFEGLKLIIEDYQKRNV